MVHLPNLIADLALILGAAALVILIFKILKQPVVLGYIMAGVLVSPNFSLLPSITDLDSITIWAEIGVIFLLFGLGLEFSFKKLIKVGGPSSITAVFEVIVMLLLGFLTGKSLGWSQTDSIFLGGILSISSTTIIIRAFGELGIKNQKFASLVFGVLIVEDLVAIILLVLLSTLALSQQFDGIEMTISILKLGFFLSLWFIGGIFLIPTFLRKTKKLINNETMLIVSLAFCFIMVVLAVKAGFSAALGAFIMGSILAETTYAEKIEHITAPVKDLFGAIFFVSVGMLIDLNMLKEYASPILLITLITIVGKTLSTTIGAVISGQTLKQSLKAGMSLAQIGEFSFIIATLGLTLKVTSGFLYPVAVAVSAITTFITPYFIRLSEPFYQLIDRRLPSKLKHRLNRYSSNIQTIRSESRWKKIIKSYFRLISINSIVIIGLIYLCAQFLFPFIITKMGNNILSSVITAFITILVMIPFLWGLAFKRVSKSSDHNSWLNPRSNRKLLIIMEVSRVVLAIFFVGYLFYQLFSKAIALIVALTIITLILLIFSKRLRLYYNLIERLFLSNLNAREMEKGKPSHVILPWDAHMAEFEIPPESPFVGKALMELLWREQFGINVAMIERGKIRINIPDRNEKIFPCDTIAVIGTDEQLEQFKKTLEVSPVEFPEPLKNQEVRLQHFIVSLGSHLIGKTIRESGIREQTHGLIVGIEREGKRILNPESTIQFLTNDVIWIVGEEGIANKLSLNT